MFLRHWLKMVAFCKWCSSVFKQAAFIKYRPCAEHWGQLHPSTTIKNFFLLQVIVKTSTQYQLQQKKNKLYVPNIKKLNISFYSDVSEKAKVQQETCKCFYFGISLGMVFFLVNAMKEQIQQWSNPKLLVCAALNHSLTWVTRCFMILSFWIS